MNFPHRRHTRRHHALMHLLPGTRRPHPDWLRAGQDTSPPGPAFTALVNGGRTVG